MSTLHRVINRSGCERYPVPIFYTGNPGVEVRCIESCLKAGGQPSCDPITVEQHMSTMYARTYAPPEQGRQQAATIEQPG